MRPRLRVGHRLQHEVRRPRARVAHDGARLGVALANNGRPYGRWYKSSYGSEGGTDCVEGARNAVWSTSASERSTEVDPHLPLPLAAWTLFTQEVAGRPLPREGAPRFTRPQRSPPRPGAVRRSRPGREDLPLAQSWFMPVSPCQAMPR
ncbi:DUF397 domain-containing protein [Streptomyces pinistramenti]|uniref:DUF397 domain-containing protein n=1 Tax=Streptomyces pinistramenti TaxID=2884812 RepID=UPI001D062E93|nr:DUF397 domain-containing protein [Streptomyces pinistramenti]MCB5908209.1 DUF397 domain-containing protein [Streptomyces pinistramenti]